MQSQHLRRKRVFSKSIFYVMIIFVLMLILAPYLWMVASSLKPAGDVMKIDIEWIPKKVTMEHYRWAFGIQAEEGAATLNLGIYIRNTLIVVGGSCGIVIVAALLGGYSLARFKFVWRDTIALGLLLTQFFPMILMLIPWYILMSQLRLVDSLSGLILTMSAIMVPFSTWMMRGFILTVPPELEECAMIDGCGRVGAFFRITVPLTLSGVIAVALYICVMIWNEYLIPLVLCHTPKTKTISVAIGELIVFQGQMNWGGIMAAGVVTSMFPIIIFIFIQRYLIAGMTVGAVKG